MHNSRSATGTVAVGPPARPMNLDICAATDTGRGRSNNEDSIAVDRETGLAVLADGMGGYNAGEVASEHGWPSSSQTELGAGCGARRSTRAAPTWRPRHGHAASTTPTAHIFNAANSNPRYAGMGTTLVVGVFRATGLLLGHVGDSRAYRLRAGRLAQITRDHSLLQEQIDAGLHHARAGGVSSQQESGHARHRRGGDRGAEMHWHALQAGDVVAAVFGRPVRHADDDSDRAAVAARLTGSSQRAAPGRRGQRGGRQGQYFGDTRARRAGGAAESAAAGRGGRFRR